MRQEYEVRSFQDFLKLKVTKDPLRFFLFPVRWGIFGAGVGSIFSATHTGHTPLWYWLESGLFMLLIFGGALISTAEARNQWKSMTREPERRLKVVR